MPEPQDSPGSIPAHVYMLALKQGWADGTLTKDEEALLRMLRKALNISDETHDALEKEAFLDIYLEAIMQAWIDGTMQAQESETLEALREQFHISAQDHITIEKQVRELLLKQKSSS